MIKEMIERAVRGIDLSEQEMRSAFTQIMAGQATDAEIGALLVALRMKGETVDEIASAARVMREKSVRIDAGKHLVDTCGTGGSGINTFNISTTAAFVAAGAGIKIAKHGNRGATSGCGSADVLEALGVRLDVGPDLVQRSIMEIGIGFLFAPAFHGAMKYAINARKQIGVRTIFNMLGPLSNPAGAQHQVLGVYDAKLTEPIARVLKKLGSRRAFVVHGADSLDEITITGRTRVSELKDGKVRSYYVSPKDFGLKSASIDEIEGGDLKENAAIVHSVLEGERSPRRDIVLANASAALVAAGKARNFKEGVKLAAESIDSGRAHGKLLQLIELTNR